MSVSKRLRFEILKRDGNKCRYCGALSGESPLTIDHVVPVALGGSDDPSNLVAACKDCNAGKSSSNPDAPLLAAVSDDALRWAAAVRSAAEAMAEDAEARARQRSKFKRAWFEYEFGRHGEPAPLPAGWATTVDAFLNAGLPLSVVLECIDITMGAEKVRFDNKFRYLCGIAWKKVSELQEAANRVVAPRAQATPGADPYREAISRMFGTIGEFDRAGYVEEMSERFDLEHEGDEGEDYSHWPADLKALALCVEEVANEHWAWAHAGEALLAKFPHAERREAIERANDELEKRMGEFTPEQVTREALRHAVLEVIKDEKFIRSVTTPLEVDF